MMLISKKEKGFTLIELMLAMTFISILLIGIAMLILQITSIYNKGLTIRSVNQAGQLISSELQRSLNQTYSQEILHPAIGATGGRLCVGSTVYAWNYPEAIRQPSTAVNRKVGGSSNIRLVKFTGPAKGPTGYCEEDSTGGWRRIPDNAPELLSGGNNNIAFHTFGWNALAVPEDTTQTIYSMSITVGTTETDLITSSMCNVNDKIGDQRCAINIFSFTARSGDKEDS